MAEKIMDLKQEFDIQSIDALHYFEYKSDFIFQSDYHEDWRLLYVESGGCEISFSRDEETYLILKEHDLFIEAPNEYYSFKAAPGTSPLVFTAGFFCQSPHMTLLSDRVFHCGKAERDCIVRLIEEGGQNFSTRLGETGLYALGRKYNQPVGGEQLIGLYLEMLLISLMRQHSAITPVYSDAMKKSDQISLAKSDSVLLNRITDYYAAHLMEGVSIDELCREFDIGRSHLQRIFREQTGRSAIDYFCHMRISIAKQLIREDKLTLTETARALGYTSLQYFSRQFKKITGIPPSEYQDSIRSAVKNPIYQHIDLDQHSDMYQAASSTAAEDRDVFVS
ncbi:MAG: helix-turn-helix transcriptional regulator [Eubacterium sp.]|nr:helix-turn-helix transcriptional regulator [Eubacterium sp.]